MFLVILPCERQLNMAGLTVKHSTNKLTTRLLFLLGIYGIYILHCYVN
uniref:Uncharacterized protein n=1 Tax=Anguilla anguilla TaxID=7936 RepID=A0A0E9XZJ8_ANGAN